jgi:general secretion pathway protein D
VAQTLRAVVSGEVSAAPQPGQGTQGGSIPAGTMSGGVSGAAAGGANQPLGPQGSTGFGGSTNTYSQQGQQVPGGAPQGAGFIQADTSTNSLIITANDAVYRNLRNVIDQLDVRRAQVYIEALVVEVSSNKASDFGIQWVGLTGNSGSDYRVGGLQSFGQGTPNNIVNLALAARNGIAAGATGGAAASLLPGGLSIGLFHQNSDGSLGLGAVARMLETDGNANILSTPNMITLDNELATIKVGKNVPIISGSFTTTSGTNTNPFQTIDRRDVGLLLKVRPQISEGGTIKLAIYHEDSSVDQTTINSPSGITTNVRAIESNVLADDGQIIVLGGLIEDNESDGTEGVHGLADLPIIGNLFKYRTRTRSKTNLMVFLRPVVVRSKEVSTNIAMDRYEYMRAAGEMAVPSRGEPLLRDLGTPVLPQLTNGQPPPGGNMAPAPLQPAPARTASPGAAPAGQAHPGAGNVPAQQAAPPIQR